jgi:uncharacterized protein (DUF952 family)
MAFPPGSLVASRVLSVHRVAADFQHGGQLNQLRLVLVGVMLAEQQFCSGGQLGANACSSAAPIAPISPGQFWTGQCCIHDCSVLPSLLSQMSALLAVFTGGLPAVSFLTSTRGLTVGLDGHMTQSAPVLVHLCPTDDWSAAQDIGELRPESLAGVGFIHLSTPQQVHLPANRLYRGREDLVLLHIDPTHLASPIRWELGVATDPESMVFPHLYGPLPIDAVIHVTSYRPDADGAFPALVE